jgi:hypothetical protein
MKRFVHRYGQNMTTDYPSAWIETISEVHATGLIDNILKVHRHRPETLRARIDMYRTAMVQHDVGKLRSRCIR